MRLSESKINRIVKQSVSRMLREMNELYQEWYDEEDYDGHTGEDGMVRSYNIGTYYTDQAEQDAEESGFDNIEDYLSYWFEEIKPDCPWYWQKIGSGYGYNGKTIFKEGGLVCKDIYGQIMFDEYPLGVNESRTRRRRIYEGCYGYPDGIDVLILMAENDRDLWLWLEEGIIRPLVKKRNRGIELSVDVLAESSVMKKWQQAVFRKYKSEQDGLTRTTPRDFRYYMAERVIDRVNGGEYDNFLKNKKG